MQQLAQVSTQFRLQRPSRLSLQVTRSASSHPPELFDTAQRQRRVRGASSRASSLPGLTVEKLDTATLNPEAQPLPEVPALSEEYLLQGQALLHVYTHALETSLLTLYCNRCRCEPQQAPLDVAILLSGGVDSSYALHLAKRAGHHVTAYYLQIWFQEDFRNYWDSCPWEDDLQYCQQVQQQSFQSLLMQYCHVHLPTMQLLYKH